MTRRPVPVTHATVALSEGQVMRFCSRIALAAVIPVVAAACASNPSNGSGGGAGATSGSMSSSPNQSSGSGSQGTPGSSSGGSGTSGSSGGSGSAGGGSSGGSGGSGGSSSNGGGGLTDGGAGDAGGGSPVVNLGQTDQTIEGFGINDMYISTALPTSLFDPVNGIGLSILRLGMDTNGVGNLESSSMTTDIATVNAAGGKVIGSVWTPPPGCKTNDNVNNGGQLCSSSTIANPNGAADECDAGDNSNCYHSWATTITNFASSNHLYAMSLANEPDFASCGTTEPCNGSYPTSVYTADEMVAFVEVAGPMLQAKGIKVIAPEASEWNHLWSNNSACGSVPSGDKSSDPLKCGCFVSNPYSSPSATCTAAASAACSSACTSGSGYDYGHALHADSTAWADFDIVGTHEYDTQVAFPWPTSDFAKDKEVWVTEMAGVKWWPEEGPTADINDGIVVAQWIHSALVTGEVSAWLWWWYQAQSTDDNEGLLLQAGSAAPSVPSLTAPDTKRHYTLGNFSKFIRPGYKRVIVSGSAPSGVELSAYASPTNSAVVVVAINANASAVSVPIGFAGGTAPTQVTPYVTSEADNLAAQTPISVSGSSFTAALGATTVTTFVGN